MKMKIYKIAAECKRDRFMEPPLYFTDEFDIIADSLDQACKYVRERLANGGNNIQKIQLVREIEALALIDVRDGEEKIIV